jgi:hypothetical protein
MQAQHTEDMGAAEREMAMEAAAEREMAMMMQELHVG